MWPENRAIWFHRVFSQVQNDYHATGHPHTVEEKDLEQAQVRERLSKIMRTSETELPKGQQTAYAPNKECVFAWAKAMQMRMKRVPGPCLPLPMSS